MSRPNLRRLAGSATASDGVVELLTTQQYLRPHQPLRDVLRAAMDELGCCPQAIHRALEWLHVDPAQPVGRLRRSELIQLGMSISRFWHQASETDAAHARSTP